MADDREKRVFTDDIYSGADLNQRVNFSDEQDVPAAAPAPVPSFERMDAPAGFKGDYAPDLPRHQRHAAPPPLNGVTWDRHVKMTRRQAMTLNNGEPVSFAIKKMIKEGLLILLCLALVGGFLYGRYFLVGKLSDNRYDALSVSSQYQKGLAIKDLVPVIINDSDGYASLMTLRGWAGLPTTGMAQMIKENDGRDVTGLNGGMQMELEKALPHMTVSHKENLPNYSLLTQIYDSLQAGAPVLVGCLNQEKTGMSHALVTAINAPKEKITLLRPDGQAEALSFDSFIAATRYAGYKKKPLLVKAEFVLGLHAKNSAYFFTEKTE